MIFIQDSYSEIGAHVFDIFEKGQIFRPESLAPSKVKISSKKK